MEYYSWRAEDTLDDVDRDDDVADHEEYSKRRSTSSLPSFSTSSSIPSSTLLSAADLGSCVTDLLAVDVGDFSEAVDDRVASLLLDAADNALSWAYDDTAGTLTPTITLTPFSTTKRCPADVASEARRT